MPEEQSPPGSPEPATITLPSRLLKVCTQSVLYKCQRPRTEQSPIIYHVRAGLTVAVGFELGALGSGITPFIAQRGPRLGPTSGPQFPRLLSRQTRFGKPGSHSRSHPTPELRSYSPGISPPWCKQGAWNPTTSAPPWRGRGLETVGPPRPGARRVADRRSSRTCLPSPVAPPGPAPPGPAPPRSPPDPDTPPLGPTPANHAPPPARPAAPPGPASQSHQATPSGGGKPAGPRPDTPIGPAPPLRSLHPQSGPGFPHSRAEPAAGAARTGPG